MPGDVDLAVVAVPAAGMGGVLDSCLAKGVKALVVLGGGFHQPIQHRLHQSAAAAGEGVGGGDPRDSGGAQRLQRARAFTRR